MTILSLNEKWLCMIYFFNFLTCDLFYVCEVINTSSIVLFMCNVPFVSWMIFPTLTSDHYVALVKCVLGFSFARLLSQSLFYYISQSLEGLVCGTLKPVSGMWDYHCVEGPSSACFRSELTALKDLRTEWFLSVPLFSSTCWRYNFAHVSIHSEVTCRRTSRMGFPRVQGTFVSPKLFLRKILRKHIYVN